MSIGGGEMKLWQAPAPRYTRAVLGELSRLGFPQVVGPLLRPADTG